MQAMQCSLCKKQYDRQKHIPKQLQCGCVQCEKCLKFFFQALNHFFCKVHNKTFNQKIEVLQTATQYLPVQQNTEIEKQTLVCAKHKKDCVLYCLNEKTLICLSCVTGDHRGHEMQSFEEAYESMKQKYETDLREFKEQAQLQDISNNYKGLNEMLQNNSSQISNLMVNVQQHFFNVISILCEQELHTQIGQIKKNQEFVQKIQNNVDSILKKIQQVDSIQSSSFEVTLKKNEELTSFKNQFESEVKNQMLQLDTSQTYLEELNENDLEKLLKNKVYERLVNLKEEHTVLPKKISLVFPTEEVKQEIQKQLLQQSKSQENITHTKETKNKSQIQLFTQYRRAIHHSKQIQICNLSTKQVTLETLSQFTSLKGNCTYSLQIFDTQIVLAGGHPKTSHMSNVTNIQGNTILNAAKMNCPKQFPSLTFNNQQLVYIINGWEQKKQYLNVCESYNINTHNIDLIAQHPYRMYGNGICYAFDMIFTFGGQNARNKVCQYEVIREK